MRNLMFSMARIFHNLNLQLKNVFLMFASLVLSLQKIRKSKTLKNSLFSMLDVAVLPVLMIVVTPMFLENLGAEQYGIWMLVNSIVASLAIADFGGADTTIKFVSAYRKNQDKDGIVRVFSSICVLYILLGALIAIFGSMGVASLISSSLFEISKQQIKVFEEALRIGVFIFVFKLFEQVILAFFKGYERYDISSIVSISSRFLVIVVQVVIVLYGGSLADIFLGMLIVQLLMFCISLFFLKVFEPTIKLILTLDFKTIKEISGYGVWVWIGSILSILSAQVDKWLVGSLAGMEILAYYSIAALVYNQLRAILAAGVSWVFPRVSRDGVDHKTSIKMYKRLQFILVFSGFLIALVLVSFDNLFLYWLGSDFYDHTGKYINSFLMLLPFSAATIVPYFYINGGGFIKYNVIYKVVLSIVNVSLMFLLYPHLGIYGIIASYGIAFVFISSLQRSVFERLAFNENNILSGFFVLIPIVLFILASYFHINFDLVMVPAVLFLMTALGFILLFKDAYRKNI